MLRESNLNVYLTVAILSCIFISIFMADGNLNINRSMTNLWIEPGSNPIVSLYLQCARILLLCGS